MPEEQKQLLRQQIMDEQLTPRSFGDKLRQISSIKKKNQIK